MRFLSLFFCSVLSAAPPVLSVTPAAPKPGDVVVITAPTNTSYDVRGVADVTRHGQRAIVFDMPTTSVVIVAVEGRVGAPADVAVLTLGSGQPGPVPPDPQPVVTPTKFRVYVIEETSEAAGNRGALFASATLAQHMRDKGHSWRIVDKDVVGVDGKPPADLVPYLDRSKGKTLPQVFLVDADGKVRFAGDMPTKASDLVELLKKYGG
jgi:hypothetical protein